MSTKSRAELLKATYEGILADASSCFPKKSHEFGRDLLRLHTILNRGEQWFFTLTLPSWSKSFTASLAKGDFIPIRGPHSATRKGSVFPKLFSGLTESIFEDCGKLREDAEINAILVLEQLLNAAKKIRMTCDDGTTVKTVQSFLDVEEEVRSPTLNWGSTVLTRDGAIGLASDGTPPSFRQGLRMFDHHVADTTATSLMGVIQSVSDRILSRFELNLPELEPHHGPGAISDRQANASKYQFGNWSEKLNECFPFSEFGLPNLRVGLDTVMTRPSNDNLFDGLESTATELYNLLSKETEVGRFSLEKVMSKLIAVPKTQKGPRLIAAEPVANMWMQQAIRSVLEQGVRRSPLNNCISFKRQEYSGDLALSSSFTNSHATIDLSDASDRLSCWLVERMFRSNHGLLQAFNAVRTDVLSIVRSKDLPVPKENPKAVKLKKFSTQGSALTFPVQTIVYALIAIGVFLKDLNVHVDDAGIEWASKEVRIFGDDIIVPTMIAGKVVQALHDLGFKVNATKTFIEGNFRESCGVHGYKGFDITPAYILEPYDPAGTASVVSLVECSNNFYKKGFVQTAERIRQTLPTIIRDQIPVVGYASGAFGFISRTGADLSPHRSRWNERLQRIEVKVLAIQSKVAKTKIRGDFALHQYFTEKPNPIDKWESGEARRSSLSMRTRWVSAETLV